MGVNIEFIYLVFTIDNRVENLLLCLATVEVIFYQVTRLALPMGVALEVIVEYLYLSIGSKILAYFGCFIVPAMKLCYLMIFLSGARLALLMGIASEAMIGCLKPIIGSKYESFDLLI
jgi:hypothetical protein